MEVHVHSVEVPEPPAWVEDSQRSECVKCRRPFTLTHRRHHCRACGEIFCAECCNYYFQLPIDFQYPTPQRTCLACFQEWSSLDFNTQYDVNGPEESRILVVLIHDACQTRKQFLPQMIPLSEDYRVVAMDLPEHGARMTEKLTLAASQKAIKEVIEKEGKDRAVILVGVCFGALMAINFACVSPSDVQALVLCNEAKTLTLGPLALRLRGFFIHHFSPQTLASRLTCPLGSMDGEFDEETISQIFTRPGIFFHAWDSVVDILRHNEFQSQLRSLHKRILMVESSPLADTSLHKWAHDSPNVTIEVRDQAGYCLSCDKRFSGWFNSTLLDYLKDNFGDPDPQKESSDEEN